MLLAVLIVSALTLLAMSGLLWLAYRMARKPPSTQSLDQLSAISADVLRCLSAMETLATATAAVLSCVRAQERRSEATPPIPPPPDLEPILRELAALRSEVGMQVDRLALLAGQQHAHVLARLAPTPVMPPAWTPAPEPAAAPVPAVMAPPPPPPPAPANGTPAYDPNDPVSRAMAVAESGVRAPAPAPPPPRPRGPLRRNDYAADGGQPGETPHGAFSIGHQ